MAPASLHPRQYLRLSDKCFKISTRASLTQKLGTFHAAPSGRGPGAGEAGHGPFKSSSSGRTALWVSQRQASWSSKLDLVEAPVFGQVFKSWSAQRALQNLAP